MADHPIDLTRYPALTRAIGLALTSPSHGMTEARADLTRLLATVRAEERERCAMACLEFKVRPDSGHCYDERRRRNWPFEQCAAAIRAMEDDDD